MRSVLMAAMLLYSGAACAAPAPGDYYGTLEPFAADAVYFVVTDRFVNGDTGNDHRDQGGAHRSFDVPTPCDGGVGDNIGYLGGDFKGIVDHADYIRGLGFGAVWITPIVDNPDEAFTGGKPITCESTLSDHGKTVITAIGASIFTGSTNISPARGWISPGSRAPCTPMT